MKVGVTGASGFIGRRLVKALSDSGYDVYKFVRREPKDDNEIYWKPSKQDIDQEKFETLDAIIHLAGESIAPKDILGFLPLAGGRWSKERKSRIYWSRKWASETFIQSFKSSDNHPKVFITASGNDVYGDHGDEVVTEETPYNRGQYLQLVVEEAWEGPLEEIKKLDVRVVKCRAGIVLGKGNVATQIFTLISKLNLSGPIGKGDQYFSWVSVQDLVSAYIFCLENSNINGPVNCTAPEPLQQKEFSRIIAKIMNKKFFAPPLPPVIMQLAVGWELGEQLGLNSIRAIPKKLLKEGFEFQNTKLESMKAEFTNE